MSSNRDHERQSVGYQESMVERICGKDRFWAWSEKVREWQAVQVVTTMNWHVEYTECEQESLWLGWLNEFDSLFQRLGARIKKISWFVTLSKEDADAREANAAMTLRLACQWDLAPSRQRIVHGLTATYST